MPTDLRFDFLVDEKAHTITVHREFAAHRQLVWDCYSRSDLLDRWFAPRPLTTKTAHMSFTPNGHWHYAMVMPDGQEFWGRLDYQTIEPIDGFTALDGFCDAAGNLTAGMPQSHWEVTFSDEGAHSTVTTLVTYETNEALQKVVQMGVQAGMTSTLERLDDLLAELS